ncbi:MAG: rhodanese-like domain-containing protein [Phycisphaerales bacterium]
MSTTAQSPGTARSVTEVSPDLLASWMQAGDTVVVDVREDYEHAEERIDGAVLRPLSRFDADAIRREFGSKRVVFHCRSGKRSLDAAGRFRAHGEPVFHLAGGIEGWKVAGRTVIRPATAPRIPVMRQVQITAGTLVVLGVALGLMASPWWLGIAAFVGCGLVFAGVTGWCGMAKLLAVMPWNRTGPSAAASGSCCSG